MRQIRRGIEAPAEFYTTEYGLSPAAVSAEYMIVQSDRNKLTCVRVLLPRQQSITIWHQQYDNWSAAETETTKSVCVRSLIVLGGTNSRTL